MSDYYRNIIGSPVSLIEKGEIDQSEDAILPTGLELQMIKDSYPYHLRWLPDSLYQIEIDFNRIITISDDVEDFIRQYSINLKEYDIRKIRINWRKVQNDYDGVNFSVPHEISIMSGLEFQRRAAELRLLVDFLSRSSNVIIWNSKAILTYSPIIHSNITTKIENQLCRDDYNYVVYNEADITNTKLKKNCLYARERTDIRWLKDGDYFANNIYNENIIYNPGLRLFYGSCIDKLEGDKLFRVIIDQKRVFKLTNRNHKMFDQKYCSSTIHIGKLFEDGYSGIKISLSNLDYEWLGTFGTADVEIWHTDAILNIELISNKI